MQLLSILGYCAACYLEATLGKCCNELLIGERVCLVFFVDKFLEYIMDLLYGYLLTFRIGDSIAKKVAQGEYAEGGLHVLADGGA